MSAPKRAPPGFPERPGFAVGAAACDHRRAQTVAYLGRSVFEEFDTSLLWCQECGALGSARYADSESIRWQTPKPSPAPVPPP